jgi:hypothetical protein
MTAEITETGPAPEVQHAVYGGAMGQNLAGHLKQLHQQVEALGNLARNDLGLRLQKAAGLYNRHTPEKACYSVWSWLTDYTNNLETVAGAFLSSGQAVQTPMAIDVINADPEMAAHKAGFVRMILDQMDRTPLLTLTRGTNETPVDVFSAMSALLDHAAFRHPDGSGLQQRAQTLLQSIEGELAAIRGDLNHLLETHRNTGAHSAMHKA